MIIIITRNLRILSVKMSIVFLAFLIIHKEFLHGFPFLYISSIEGGE